MAGLSADADFLDLYEIPLLSGRRLVPEEVVVSQFSPLWEVRKLLINETAADRLGVGVGDVLEFSYGPTSHEVVGVFRDFHFRTLHTAISPLFIAPGVFERQAYLSLRVDMVLLDDILAAIRSIWKEYEPNRPFEYTFMDESLASRYEDGRRLSRAFTLSSALAIAIAAVGLLGLIAYAAEARTREVAIRKVLGASEPGIMWLLTKELLIVVLASSLLAHPIAYMATSEWLQSFAYRIPVTPVYFAVGTLASLAIALATTSIQAMRAARANPAEVLAHH